MQSSPSRPGTRFSCTCRRGPSAPPYGQGARLATRRRVPERSPRHSRQAVGRRLPSRRALVVAWLPPWNSVTCQFYGGRCIPANRAGGAFHAHTCGRQLEAGGIAWRSFYALLHSAVERQLDESAPQTAPVGTTIGTGSIFGGAHEILIRQVSRYHAAERPDVAGWPAPVMRPSPASNADELRATDGVPPVSAGRRCNDPRYPVRKFSVLRDHGARSGHARWSRFHLRTRVPHCRLRGLDPRPGRPKSTAPSTSPSLASPKRSVPWRASDRRGLRRVPPETLVSAVPTI